MLFRRVCIFSFLVVGLLTSIPALACMGDVPSVTEDDLLHPPKDMLAFKGIITDFKANGPLDPKPHNGFDLTLKITKMYQGEAPGEFIQVEYGSCHNAPGEKGQEIAVLAIKGKTGWYAPQFWEDSK